MAVSLLFFLASDQKAGALFSLLIVHFLLLCAHPGQTSGKTMTRSNKALSLTLLGPQILQPVEVLLPLMSFQLPLPQLLLPPLDALGVQVLEKSRREKEKKEKTWFLPFFLSIRNSFYWCLSQNRSFSWSFLSTSWSSLIGSEVRLEDGEEK